MLALVQLAHLGSRYPRQLSGGQQQRVAMARALVSRPRLLLMDEPLGALDKKLREQMQIEIKRIHRSVGTTVIYVTHDQAEALTMSDVVVVMHQARIAQIGTPRALYEAPANLFVADFLGDSNLLAAKIVEVSGADVTVELANGEIIQAARGDLAAVAGDRVVVLIRPEDMSLHTPSDGNDGHHTLTGTVQDVSYHGDTFKLDVAVGEETLEGQDRPRARRRIWSRADRSGWRGSRQPRGCCRRMGRAIALPPMEPGDDRAGRAGSNGGAEAGGVGQGIAGAGAAAGTVPRSGSRSSSCCRSR